MTYKAEFTGWNNLSIGDLIVAYRKAKADSFFENTFPTAEKFAVFESDLHNNLNNLLSEIKKNNGFISDKKLLGECRLLPKKMAISPKLKKECNGHIHISDPKRSFDCLTANNKLIPEFRIIGNFPVEMHIISALWINMIGHKYDAILSSSCYGGRLRRIATSNISINEENNKSFHINAIGSFSPYFQPYKKWRNDGLIAIRRELENNHDVIAVSLDLQCYYHYIDMESINYNELNKSIGIKLTDAEDTFTKELFKFLALWSKEAESFSKRVNSKRTHPTGGLVIGLTVSRIISNVLLHEWDKLIKEKVSPIHYGRYVDDMFLVVSDSGVISSSDDFMHYLKERLGPKIFSIKKDDKSTICNINQGNNIQGKSVIRLQGDKQKLFILQGRAGLDLLDSIERDINELSSEHRLMPTPEQLEDSTAARVLSASASVAEKADTLRRADGLTIRRLSWSLQLRHVETLALDLPKNMWKKQREDFYQFAFNHIIRPENIFAHYSYLPRLLGFAINMGDWQQAEKIVVRSLNALEQIENAIKEQKDNRVMINGSECKAKSDIWGYIKGTLIWQYTDSVLRNYPISGIFSEFPHKNERQISKIFLDKLNDGLNKHKGFFNENLIQGNFRDRAKLILLSDLGRIAYKNIYRTKYANKLLVNTIDRSDSIVVEHFKNINLIDVSMINRFLESTKNKRLPNINNESDIKESIYPYLFPTRPFSPAEISELAPECVGLINSDVGPSAMWARYSQALRGVWVKPTLLAQEQDDEKIKNTNIQSDKLIIGTKRKRKIIVALTNLKVDDSDWDLMASNKSNLSLERYQRISEIVNHTLRLNPKPDYVLFPELSLPRRWLGSISSRLNSAGISLIAGTEYRHEKENMISSEAYLSLSDNRLGYPAFTRIWQPKKLPAVGEDYALTKTHGKNWYVDELHKEKSKPIYVHNDFHFGIMVCSELQNSKDRIAFQGNIDALMVLSWNQDLDTFSSLIESSALDIHAYTILVNNRKYGDSRVRVPAKESYLRDTARVRGGDNDFVIAATLDIESLRKFQSRAKRWPNENDPFKPVPEGFYLLNSRKVLPAK